MAYKRFPKIYMGKDSVAKIPTRGKVNSFKEIVTNAFATAVDLLDRRLLTHIANKTTPAMAQVVNGRFLVLKRLAKRFSPRAYRIVDKLHEQAVMYLQRQITAKEYFKNIKAIVKPHLKPNEIAIVLRRVH